MNKVVFVAKLHLALKKLVRAEVIEHMNKKTFLIIGAVIVVLGLIGAATSSTKQSVDSSQKPENTQNTSEPVQQVGGVLAHNDLLAIAKSDPNEVLNQIYEMTLYLEQQPTGMQAEFMSQPDDNNLDTILITCNMSTTDLNKLDGASAQSRNYKPYNLNVTFTRHDDNVELYYEAQCELR